MNTVSGMCRRSSRSKRLRSSSVGSGRHVSAAISSKNASVAASAGSSLAIAPQISHGSISTRQSAARVAHAIGGDKPEAVYVHDAELGGVLLTRAALPPCFAGDEKAITRHIEWIDFHGKEPALHAVDLRVDQDRATLRLASDFTDPMVEPAARFEVTGEAAARPRQRSLAAQHRHQEQSETAADADHALAR